MAAKNITVNGDIANRPTGAEVPGNDPAPVTVGGRPSGAAGDVWDALTGSPGASVTVIAEASGVSRATVARTLTNLERQGRATRTRGERDGGKRQSDTWHPVATTPDQVATTGDTPDTSAKDVLAGEAVTTDASPVTTDTPDAEPTDVDAEAGQPGDTGAGMDAAAVAEARDALTVLRDAIAAAMTALEGGDGAGALTAVEGVYGGSGRARRLVRAAANGRPRTASGAPRSAPGEMRGKVAGHLIGHPGAAFTPHEIAKVIGHSAGAVSNALDRLTEAGEAELVCDRPRRFTATVRPAARAAH
ncbi:MarR family transcriptional regulator [Actinomadura macra]|uniref:MarR family transcriptional regulator n=1 Tax=Actinomadura macra TaxID=46164 RepID=UPI00082F30DE|nr:helix-turn-helix domain-containing protein [Actinomadura macra]